MRYPSEEITRAIGLLTHIRTLALYDLRTDDTSIMPYWIISACRQTAVNYKAFHVLVEAEIASAALGLVRAQIDVAARVNAVTLVEDWEKYLAAVMRGRKIGSLRDRNGLKLSDRYLFEKLIQDVDDWGGYLEKFRSVGCANVHFSHSAVMRSLRQVDEDRFSGFRDLFEDAFLDEEEREGTILAMEMATSTAIGSLMRVQQVKRSSQDTDLPG